MRPRYHTKEFYLHMAIDPDHHFGFKFSDDLKQSLANLPGCMVSEEDQKSFKELTHRGRVRQPGTSYLDTYVTGSLSIFFASAAVYGYFTQKNFPKLASSFHPIHSPQDVHYLPDSDPLSPYINSAINEQAPKSTIVDYVYSHGLFIPNAQYKNLDVAEFNASVQHSLEHPNIEVGNALIGSAVCLTGAFLMAATAHKARKEVSRMYDKYFLSTQVQP